MKFQNVELLDITAPEEFVQVEVRSDGKVLWVHVDGITVLRICRISTIIDIADYRPPAQGQPMSQTNIVRTLNEWDRIYP